MIVAPARVQPACARIDDGATRYTLHRVSEPVTGSLPIFVAKRKPEPVPMPDDFGERAATMRIADLMKHYRRGQPVIIRWIKESGVSRKRLHSGPAMIAMPDDFSEQARALGYRRRALGAHYGFGHQTIERLLREAGLFDVRPEPRTRRAVRKLEAKPAPLRTPANAAHLPAYRQAPVASNRDQSAAGQAADYLRRFGPVVRCDASGAYSEGGTYWRRGSTVLCADEVIERAERLGWKRWSEAA